MADTMTIADALTELKRIKKIMPRKIANISIYSSKRRGAKDQIEGQAKFVKSETKAVLDLIKRFESIKGAVNASNLEATIVLDGETMTVGHSILFKQQYKEMYETLYNAFTPTTGQRQVDQHARYLGSNMANFSDKQLADLDLIPELLYKEKTVIAKKEHYLNMYSEADRLIEKSNHATTITV